MVNYYTEKDFADPDEIYRARSGYLVSGPTLDENQTVKVPAVDREKTEKDALYNGYFAIITSEMDYDATKIREVYHGLWRIEEFFRIMKSDFDARPI